MTHNDNIITKLLRGMALSVIFTVLGTTVASAAPQLDVVELERDRVAVSHSDERLEYLIKVGNTAPFVVVSGKTLTCYTGTWANNGPSVPHTFTYQWLRNGEDIAGATTNTYTVTAADEGKVLECQLTVTNTVPDVDDSANFIKLVYSVTGVVVDPQPVTPPPTAPNILFRPEPSSPLTVGGPGGQTLTCNPGTWTGSPTFTYRWYRNGELIVGATEPTYVTTAGDVATKGGFQCVVTGTNAGGSRTKASNFRTTTPAPDPGEPVILDDPALIETEDYTKGPVTVEFELPGGEETFVHEAAASSSQWSCDKVPASGAAHAKAICVSSRAIPPGGFFQPFTVVAALGADAPEIGVAKATAFGGGAEEPASAVDEFTFDPFKEFSLVDFEANVCGTPPSALGAGICFDEFESADDTRAGGHPFAGVGVFELTTKRTLAVGNGEGATSELAPVEHIKQVITDLPRGQVGNALALPELCGGVDVLKNSACPPSSAIGLIDVAVRTADVPNLVIYAIEPEFGAPAQFAFEEPLGSVITLTPRLRADDGYAISLVTSPPQKIDFLEATARLCGYGVDFSSENAPTYTCQKPDAPGANPKPLITNPTRCGQPAPVTRARVRSWEQPNVEKTFSFTNKEITECDQVGFEPEASLLPNSNQADSGTGLDVELTMPTNGLEGKDDLGNPDPDALSQSHLKRAKIFFPEGMAVNPTAGKGLGACSPEQVKLETNLPIECPDSSKIGSVAIETPIIEETLVGDVYVAKQGTVGGALVGFYMVFDSKKDGILIKIPARVDPNPQTGQLVATVDNLPQAPFATARLHFPGGPQATLLTPPKCGTYEVKAEMTPWSAVDPANPTPEETVTTTSTFEVNSGPNGGPCPSGGLEPKLNAGTQNPAAGKTSPFVMRLWRDDGTQRFSGLNIHTPPGLTGYLKGIPYCPESALASISGNAGTGQAQIASPSCPAASQVGRVIAGAGAGPDPLFVDTGRVYLAGPYKGAPLSFVAVAPAVAGPLDLGTVVVRNAAYIDPETAEISVVSDPVPTILHGLLLDVRDIRVLLDRPNFTLNPTNCEPKSVKVDVKGEKGGSASVSDRFQAQGCENLKFKPKLSIGLIGGTKRGDNPKVRAVYTTGDNEANADRAAVTIPRSEFLDQAHIRTICTRVQFAADACPKGSVYGHVTAHTPLLDFPVKGPIYLRSSNHKLPDLVFALRGPDYQPVEAVVVARVDSIKGQIRVTIENAPDVPVSKLIVIQQGGKKGLLINSRDICASKNLATVKLTGQNGKAHNFRPAVKNAKCNQQHKAKQRRR